MNEWGVQVLHWPVDPQKFGTVGQWFSCLTATVAVIISAITFVNQQRRADETRQREIETATEDERREKASSLLRIRQEAGAVYCWVEILTDTIRMATLGGEIIVHNATPVPVYTWTIREEASSKVVANSSESGPLIPGRTTLTHISSTSKALLITRPRLEIEFTASNGESLRRNYEGQLTLMV